MYPEWIDNIDHSEPFITGNGFASYCRHIYNYNGYVINDRVPDNNLVFCKTDYIHDLFLLESLPTQFILITHNSDYPINAQYCRILDSNRVIAWHAANVACDHPKLKSIPLGIANAGYDHGNADILKKVQNEHNEKINDVYVNFNIVTNRPVREYCLSQIGKNIVPADHTAYDFAGGYKQPRSFETYLRDLSTHRFCVSPQGNGVDCLRHWESLYVKTIPIVCGFNWQNDLKLPIIQLSDWSEFNGLSLSQSLYDDVWADFDIGQLHLQPFFHSHIKSV
jgi:hypothetical protein